MCDNDANCKGFVEKLSQDENSNWYSSGCQYATVDGASTCKSSGCSYVRSGGLEVGEEVTEVGDLDDGHRKHVPYCGCWRKVIFIIYELGKNTFYYVSENLVSFKAIELF